MASLASFKTGRRGFIYNAGILFRLLKFILPYKGQVLLNVLSLICITLFMYAMPWIMGQALDSVEGNPTSLPLVNDLATPGSLLYLLLAAAGVLVAGALRGLFYFGQTYLNQTISQHAAYDVRNALYAAFHRQSYSFYDKMPTAELMSRATADVESARMLMSMGLPRPIQTATFFIVIMVFLWLTSPALAVITLIGIPFVGYRAIVTSVRMRPIWLSIQEGLASMTTVLQENLSGAKVVRSFARQGLEEGKFGGKTDEIYDRSVRGTYIRSSNTALMTFVVYFLIGIVLLYGGREIIEGRMSHGQLLQAFLYLVMLSEQVRMLGFMGDVLSRSVAAGERIFEVLDVTPDIMDRPGARPIGAVEGSVGFENVSFSYGAVAPALRNVTLEARPNQVVAVIGATGSGKTTLVSLIPRFYDVTAGRITIDRTDVREVALDSLRRNVGIVQQDVFLFSATIRENIAYGRSDAPLREVVRVAKAARLHDFIESLPNGYDTWVGERGITLSGGQKQRVAIARTLLLDPRILILDDSLSSVDTETEYLIQQALSELMRDRTTFIIAQRLISLKRADQILVLKDGEIVQRGTHAELLEGGGLYRDIYEMQLRQQEEALEAVRGG